MPDEFYFGAQNRKSGLCDTYVKAWYYEFTLSGTAWYVMNQLGNIAGPMLRT